MEYFVGVEGGFAGVALRAGTEEVVDGASGFIVRAADAEVAENDVGVARDSDLLVSENEVNVVVEHSGLPGQRREHSLVARRNHPTALPFVPLRADRSL